MSEQYAEVGVVFVHGIGEQLQGQTVAEYGEALVGYVERAVADGGEATLEIDRDDPTITLAVTNANTSTSIEVSEAWWAEDFERPDLSSVVKWSALLAPWIVTREAAYSWERLEGFSILAGLLPEEARRRKAAMVVLFAALYVTGLLRLMMTALRGVAFMLGGVILQIALVILLALSYLHVPGLRRAIRWIHDRLTGSIGDAYAFLAIDDSSGDIASAALAGLAAAAARCERLGSLPGSGGRPPARRRQAHAAQPRPADHAWAGYRQAVRDRNVTARETAPAARNPSPIRSDRNGRHCRGSPRRPRDDVYGRRQLPSRRRTR